MPDRPTARDVIAAALRSPTSSPRAAPDELADVVLDALTMAGYSPRPIDYEWTVASMSAAIEDGELLMQFEGGTTEKVAKFLACMADVLLAGVLDENGDPGENYAMAELVAGPRILSVAACRSRSQTPHALRLAAEAEVERLRAQLAEVTDA